MFLFIFGINHRLGCGISGDEPRIHPQQCAMPFTSPQGEVPFPHVSPCPQRVYTLVRQGNRHLLQ